MKTAKQLFLIGAILALSTAAAAAQAAAGVGQAAVDTSKWKCELCKFQDGLSGAVEVGAGHVSDDSYKFGEYTGLHEKGGFLIGEGTARFRGADGAYWNANASDLGLKSRALDVEGGRQGRYKLFLQYDELPHYISDSARTPFAGNGGPSLTLPAGFPAANTSVMPLAGSLQQFDISTQRKRLGIGGSLIPGRDWEYAADFRRETKEGTKRTAGAFFINAAQLVEPVDYVTDQINAS
ncbi:MAG: MtrB/PioB family outer membrane beta-barrel protein, partial [Gammaproteobacteria bacterium]|nr:MtrB/PioB family outer membrane beta-barrel protein [Gammaproteobacteria bacterium]